MTYLHFKTTTLSTVGKRVATKVEAGSTVRGWPSETQPWFGSAWRW